MLARWLSTCPAQLGGGRGSEKQPWKLLLVRSLSWWRRPRPPASAAGPRPLRSRRGALLATSLTTFMAGGLFWNRVPDTVGPIYQFETSDGDVPSPPPDDDDRHPLRYQPQKLQAYWDCRPYEVTSRTLHILAVFVPFLSKLVFWECLIRRKILHHEGLQTKYAARLRDHLVALGPCFVKLGQALSIRPDLLPATVLAELQKLCDAVPSFPTAEALRVIEQELPQVESADRLFLDLDESTQPIAAASLGQVYRLRLRSNKEWVAVKVQRPDMMDSVLLDVYILRRLAQFVEILKSILPNRRPYEVALIDAFATASVLELDYLNEALNQDRFRKELVPRLKGDVYVPKVYHEWTTRKVLVTEWVDGQQLAKSPKDVINRLTGVGIKCFLVQLLETGYFHADPHPGNLLVTPDGKLALIDFGLCADVPLPDTRTMTLAIVHLMQGDVGGLIRDAIDLGFLPADADVDRLQPELQRVYDSAQLAMETQWRQDEIGASKYKAVTHRRKRFMAVSYDLNKIFFKYPFIVPDYFALITRAMIVLEGIAVTGDPEFDLFSSAYPYAFKRAITLFGVSNLSQIATEMASSQLRRMTQSQSDATAVDK